MKRRKNLKEVLFASKWILFFFVVASSLMVSSCKDYDDDIDALKKDIAENKTAIQALQTAATGGKGVKSVETVDGATVITLSDNTKYTLSGASAVTIGADGYWYINGVKQTVKAAGNDGVSPIIGPNGNWFIGGTDTNVKAKGEDGKNGTGTSSEITVVEKADHFMMTIKDSTGTKEVKLPKAAMAVSSVTFVPRTVSTQHVGCIIFPRITEEYYRGTAVWGTTTTTTPLLAANYVSGKAKVSYKMNPSTVAFDSFRVVGMNLKEADIVTLRSASPLFTLSGHDQVANFGKTEAGQLDFYVSANLPTVANKSNMVALVVENKTVGATPYVYSEYAPAQNADFGADLVKETFKSSVRRYELLHPAMTEAQVALYSPFANLPQTANTALFQTEVAKVRNFTLEYNDAKGINLKDTLDGIFGDADAAGWLPANFFKENGFDNYTLEFEPVKFMREGVDQTERYLNLNQTTGQITVKDFQYAAIDRVPVVRVNMKVNGKLFLSRIIMIHIIEKGQTTTEVNIPISAEFLIPNCNIDQYLDLDKIYNHPEVRLGKDVFYAKYPTFTQLYDAQTPLQGVINLIDRRLDLNQVQVQNISNQPIGTYIVKGKYSGPGMKDIFVTWTITLKYPVVTVSKEVTPNYWVMSGTTQTDVIEVHGRPGRLNHIAATEWDMEGILRNAFIFPNSVTVGTCPATPAELGFRLRLADMAVDRKLGYYIDAEKIQPANSTALPFHNYANLALYGKLDVQPGATTVNHIGRSFVDRDRIKVEAIVYIQGYPNAPVPAVWASNGQPAKFEVQFKNPVQPLVGKNGSAVAGGQYLIDKKVARKAQLGKLFSLKDYINGTIYNYGAPVVGTSIWNTTLVDQYQVGIDPYQAVPAPGVTATGTTIVQPGKWVLPAGNPKVVYELLTRLPGTAKVEITPNGEVTWDNTGEDLQTPLNLEFRITVPNQWNIGEYSDTKGRITTTVTIPVQVRTFNEI